MKSHEILDQFDKSIKSYIEMFETLGLLSTTPPPPHPTQVGLKHLVEFAFYILLELEMIMVYN